MYTQLLDDIGRAVSVGDWTSLGIATYPDNYQGKINSNLEFCRINVLPAASTTYGYGAKKQLSGVIIVSIFVKAGEGQKRVMQIADALDNVLQYKNLINGTELGASYTSMEGLDTANNSLYRARYTIPFKLYGD